MITVELKDWEELDLKNKVVEKVADQIIRIEFKLYGDIPDEGCYTPYDKFKNYIANLVADRIFKYMIENDEIQKRIDLAINKASESIVIARMKREMRTRGMANER